MKNVAALVTRQFRVFPPDIVPFYAVLTAAGSDVLRRQFNFREVLSPDAENTDAIFRGGLIMVPEAPAPVTILSLHLNHQRIILEVVAETPVTNTVYEMVAQYMATLDSRRALLTASPLLLTHETQCDVELALGWADLISDQLRGFVEKDVLEHARTPGTTTRIRGLNLRFSIAFNDEDEERRDFGAVHADKTLIIEPRMLTPLSSAIFFTQSPLTSDAHLSLLERFERTMGHGPRKPRRR